MHIIADVILSMGYIFYDFLAKMFEYKLIFLPLSKLIYISLSSNLNFTKKTPFFS